MYEGKSHARGESSTKLSNNNMLFLYDKPALSPFVRIRLTLVKIGDDRTLKWSSVCMEFGQGRKRIQLQPRNECSGKTAAYS